MVDQAQRATQSVGGLRLAATFKSYETQAAEPPVPDTGPAGDCFEIAIHRH